MDPTNLHQVETMPRTLPKMISDMSSLKAGDILIFRSDPLVGPTIEEKAIAFFQSLTTHKEGGHYYSTHAGICVGVNNKDESMIAHVTDTSNPDIIEYIKETLSDYMHRERIPRPFVVYRPLNAEMATKISEIAANAQNGLKNHITWEYSSAARAIFSELTTTKSSALLNLPVKENEKSIAEKDFSLSTHCSKFVAEVINHATHSLNQQGRSVDPTCSVKNLEHLLYNDIEGYEELYYPGIHCPYNVLKQEILKQLNHIKLRNDEASQKKYTSCQTIFDLTTKKLDANPDLDPLQKANLLLQAMDGLLAINTGHNLKTAGSHQKIVELAKHFCLFSHSPHTHVNIRNLKDPIIPENQLRSTAIRR